MTDQVKNGSAMPLIIRVALDAAAFGYDLLYSYTADPQWAAQVAPGMRVAVPFGRGNRRRLAMVLEVSDEPAEEGVVLKPAAALLDQEPVLTEELLMLVRWLHEYTFCTWYDAVRAVLPGGLQLQLEERYLPLEPPVGVKLTEKEHNLLSIMQLAKSQRERDALVRADGDSEKQKILDALVQKGCLLAVSEGKQLIGDSTKKNGKALAELSCG